MKIIEYIKGIKKRRSEALYIRGYNWAAGVLLARGDLGEVQGAIDCAKDFGQYNQFDSGSEQALRDYHKRINT